MSRATQGHSARAGSARRIALSVVATALLGAALGQNASLAGVQPTMDQLSAARSHLANFEDVAAAEAAGYERFGDCMSSPQGAQGIHYRNVDLIGDPALDPMAPELLMYEPRSDGSLRLVGAEWIVFQQAWHDAGSAPSPTLYGREFSLNTTLLDEPFYALHLWVWQYNPLGLFANWNPLVQCGGGMASTH